MKFHSDYNFNEIQPNELGQEKIKILSNEKDFKTEIPQNWDKSPLVSVDGLQNVSPIETMVQKDQEIELIQSDDPSEIQVFPSVSSNGKRERQQESDNLDDFINKRQNNKKQRNESDKILKMICKLVGELYESIKMIQKLELEMNENTGLEDHFKKVILSQREKFRKDIWKNLETILGGYDQMLKKSSCPKDVAYKISKATRLTVEEVECVISGCIQLEDKCRREKEKIESLFEPGKFVKSFSGGKFSVDYSKSLEMILKNREIATSRTGTVGKNLNSRQKNGGNSCSKVGQNHLIRKLLTEPAPQRQMSSEPFRIPDSNPNLHVSSSLIRHSVPVYHASSAFVPSQNSQQLLPAQNDQFVSASNVNNFDCNQNRLYPVSIADVHDVLDLNGKKNCFDNFNSFRLRQSSSSAHFNSRSSTHTFAPGSTLPVRPSQIGGNQSFVRFPDPMVPNYSSHIVGGLSNGAANVNPGRQNMNLAPRQPSNFAPQRPHLNPSNHFFRHSIPVTSRLNSQSHENFSFVHPDNATYPSPAFTSTFNQIPAQRLFTCPPNTSLPSSVGNCSNILGAPGRQMAGLTPEHSFRSPSFNLGTQASAHNWSPLHLRASLTDQTPKQPETFPCQPPQRLQTNPSNLSSSLPLTDPSNFALLQSQTQPLPPSLPPYSMHQPFVCASARENHQSTSSTSTRNRSTDESLKVHDPTIPQKLTLKDQRLQAGDALACAEGKKRLETTAGDKMPLNVVEKDDQKEGLVKDKEVEEEENLLKIEKEEEDIEIIEEFKVEEDHNSSRLRMCAEADCLNIGIRICKGCFSVIYCSDVCQLKHWRMKHKEECKKLKELMRQE